MDIKNVLLIGGCGFVGGWIANRLSEQGLRVIIPTRRRDNNRALLLLPTVDVVEADVNDPAALAALMQGQDAVINLAGILHDADSRLPYGKGFAAAHVELPKKIVVAMQQAGVRRLVHMSALNAAVDAPSEYLRSKGEGEAAVLAAGAAGTLDVTVFRPSVICGPGDSFLNMFAKFLRLLPVFPLGGAAARFQPVYVGDVAEAVAASLVLPQAAGRTYELGGPAVWSFKDILKYILRETGRSRILAPLPVFVAATMGRVTGLTAMVGIPPVLTRDQVLMLKTDNVVSPDALGLKDLGIEATGLEAIAPSYLWRYRRGGQFAENPGAAVADLLP